MKKLLMTLLVAVFSLTASAQFYVGGQAGFWRNSDANHTNFTLRPEFGYQINDKWDIGMGFGFSHDYNGYSVEVGDLEVELDHVKVNGITFDPYARWSFAKLGPVHFFLDMGFGINTYKVKADGDYESDAQVGWRIGVQPGMRVAIAKHLDFVAHVGFLGYQEADDGFCSYGEDGFGFNVNGNNLTFGLNYVF